MLSDEQIERLYDEFGQPYTDEELKVHSRHRTLKDELEMEHAYNHEAIMVTRMWIDYINGKGPTPPADIWKILRPGKNFTNDRCVRLRSIYNYFKEYEHGECPKMPIVVFCSRSTATLIRKLNELYQSPKLDDAEAHLNHLGLLISNLDKRRLTHDQFVAELDEGVAGLIVALESYSQDLGYYLRELMGKHPPKPRDVKVDMILEQLRTKAEKKDVRTVVGSAKKEILNKLDGEEEKTNRKHGSITKVRKEQVTAVKLKLLKMADAGVKMSLHAACVAVWQNIKGGYSSAKALYEYCHQHKEEFAMNE